MRVVGVFIEWVEKNPACLLIEDLASKKLATLEQATRVCVFSCFMKNEELDKLIGRLHLRVLQLLFKKSKLNPLSREYFQAVVAELKQRLQFAGSEATSLEETATNSLAEIIQMCFEIYDQPEILFQVLQQLKETSLVRVILKRNKRS